MTCVEIKCVKNSFVFSKMVFDPERDYFKLNFKSVQGTISGSEVSNSASSNSPSMFPAPL